MATRDSSQKQGDFGMIKLDPERPRFQLRLPRLSFWNPGTRGPLLLVILYILFYKLDIQQNPENCPRKTI